MRESVIYQEILQEGLQKGQEEGQIIGRHDGELHVILQYLSRKFGSLEENIKKQLPALSIADLDELVDTMFDFQDINDLKQWLQAKQ